MLLIFFQPWPSCVRGLKGIKAGGGLKTPLDFLFKVLDIHFRSIRTQLDQDQKKINIRITLVSPTLMSICQRG